jgi:hypothetical protein
MTTAGGPRTPLALKKKPFPHSKYSKSDRQDLPSCFRRARRGHLSPRSTRDRSDRSRERAWAPTASSPVPASTRRSFPHQHRRTPRAPAGCADTPSPPLAPPCTPSSAATPRRARRRARRRGPTSRGGRRHVGPQSRCWLPRARRRWGAPCVLVACCLCERGGLQSRCVHKEDIEVKHTVCPYTLTTPLDYVVAFLSLDNPEPSRHLQNVAKSQNILFFGKIKKNG